MINGLPVFGLPLVNHLVQQGLLNFLPPIALQMAPTDRNLQSTRPVIRQRNLAQATSGVLQLYRK